MSAEAGSSNKQPGGVPPKSGGDFWRRAAADVVAGARTAAPVVKGGAARFGDWLASIGWGKFFFVAFLLFVLVGILNSILFERGPAIVIDDNGERDSVDISVAVSEEGITIAPRRSVRKAPEPPVPPAAAGTEQPPAVSIDDKGVRISAEKDGRSVTVVIDGRGVRINEQRPDVPAASGPQADTVVIPRDAIADPEKVEGAVEAVRDKIEEIIDDQVARQVANRTRVYREQSSDWLLSLVAVLILASIIFKVVLGSKKKAESRAQAATATAAAEGLKRQLAEAQLKMMQAQVEPHFLFNTLASVEYLIETDPPRAAKMQKNLIQYLRAALPQMREGSTTLGKEIALCRAYLEILKVRMDERLQFAITVPQGLASAQFPPMMLQSLIENAIKHGLEPKPEGGSLTLGADVANGNLRVTVADTGLGFGTAGKPGSGVGLGNVRERLAALYGGRAQLAVVANTPTGTIATIEVPYTIETGEANGSPAGTAGRPAAA